MQIIAHRGYWNKKAEKNTLDAFKRAFEFGFGVETDIRDQNGKLVISHDIPQGECISCDDFFKLYKSMTGHQTLALNIKSDGLQLKLKELIAKYNIDNYYVFDMSIPDTLGFINQDMKILSRHSNFEPNIPFASKRLGVWCDSFNDDAASMDIALEEIGHGRVAILVSPELHARPYGDVWREWLKAYRKLDEQKRELLMICTDEPVVAKDFFRGTL